MKKFLIAALLFLGLGLTTITMPAYASQAEKDLCTGAGLDWVGSVKDGHCRNDKGGPSVEQTLENVVNVIAFLAGGIAVIMIVIGGLRYILSNGEQAQVTNAKNTIIYACVGLVVIIMAYAIVRFVIRSFA